MQSFSNLVHVSESTLCFPLLTVPEQPVCSMAISQSYELFQYKIKTYNFDYILMLSDPFFFHFP